ncbi:Holliday junction resolvase RuvX [Kineococcus gynurae]|uniref:Putative pre-16S rRNA nuclease n=1 Tax=Kineococcus gynurae TaxID=452979 RepID=A0ABV5LUX2_9ACTN
MRPGVRVAVDVGSVRVGVAACDPDGVMASPVATMTPHDLDPLVAEVRRRGAVEVVVGLPLSLDGTEGRAAGAAGAYARALRARLDVPVRLVDERLTTVDAHRSLHAAGRKEKDFRSVVDQAAAVALLQHALDVERTSGRPPGRLLGEQPDGSTGNPGGPTPVGRKPRHRRRGGPTGSAASSDPTEG